MDKFNLLDFQNLLLAAN